ncbi:hypothetical protein LEN26_005272, partial [Aphanomyces euteiches]
MWCCQPRSRLAFFWSILPNEKTAVENEAEKWAFVVPYAPRRRVDSCPSVQRILVCSILNHYIDEHIQDKARDSVPPAKELAVVTFYVAVGAHGFASALFGPFVERHGPRHSLIIAVCLHIVGHVMSFVSVYYKSYIGLYIGY